MKKEDLKVGDKVRLVDNNLGWFDKGAVLTYKESSSPATGAFYGPAMKDGVGGMKCSKDDTITGHAYFRDVEPIEGESKPVRFSVTVGDTTTTVHVAKSLTTDQVSAMLKAAGL